MQKIRTAIMGSTGLVGQQFARMLKDHPYFEVVALTASQASSGKKFHELADWLVEGSMPEYARNIVVKETSIQSLKKEKVKVVFSALPSSAAINIEKNLADEGIYVFSNASAYRMNPEVPILIPEVNPDHLELVKSQLVHRGGFIVTNSNCTTSGLVLALKPLTEFGIKRVSVTTFQAVSGAGRRGLAAIDILGNVIPYIKDEEDKVEAESRKILGTINGGLIQESSIDFNVSCCRVPVRNGHLECVSVELHEEINIVDLTESLMSFQGLPQKLNLPTAPEQPIILRKEKNRPQPIIDYQAGSPARAKGMAVTIGRVRKRGNRVNFFLLVHNTIRGAAGTCVLNAELSFNHGYIRLNS